MSDESAGEREEMGAVLTAVPPARNEATATNFVGDGALATEKAQVGNAGSGAPTSVMTDFRTLNLIWPSEMSWQTSSVDTNGISGHISC